MHGKVGSDSRIGVTSANSTFGRSRPVAERTDSSRSGAWPFGDSSNRDESIAPASELDCFKQSSLQAPFDAGGACPERSRGGVLPQRSFVVPCATRPLLHRAIITSS